jgi:hypothetical protein
LSFRGWDKVSKDTMFAVEFFKAKNAKAMEKEIRIARASFNNKVSSK